MLTARTSTTARRHLGVALTGAALIGVLAAPAVASAKPHHRHHAHRAQRAEVPTQSCTPGDLLMTGKGKQARLWVCRADGTWTEAVYAVSQGGQTTTVNAGRI